VGAREQQAIGGELRVRRPHLLAVEDEAARPKAVALGARLLGTRLDPREIGAGRGLGEQLAPDLIAVEHRAEVAPLLLVGAVGDDRRPEHPDADRVEDPRHFRARYLLVADDLVDRAEPLASVLLGPGDARERTLRKPSLP